jgi:hypothetical protein
MLPKVLREQTTIVAPKKEIFKLSAQYVSGVPEYIPQPDPDMKIGDKRAWILEEFHRRGEEKIIMLDDDLRFATRISETDWHLREIKGEELIPEFERIAERLSPETPHAGFGQRQGNNQLEEVGWKSPGKMCYALGYYLPVVIKECVFRRIALREDMELALQLLVKGYPNAVYHTTVVDQRGYDKPGGTSFERTVEISNAEAHKLKELFPSYVSTVERAYKASTPRVEVIVQWQKALEDGRRYRAQIEATAVS